MWTILKEAMASTGSFPAVVDLLPAPGEWTEAEYYPFSEQGRLVELSDWGESVLRRFRYGYGAARSASRI